jgi:AraC family transcriptional regulator
MLTLTMPALDHAGRYSARGLCPLHSHRQHELLVVREGTCRLEIEDFEPMEAGPGSVHLLPPHHAHIHLDHCHVVTTYAIFQIPLRLLTTRLRHFQVALDDPLIGWLDQVTDLHCRSPQPDPRQTGGLLLAILSRIDSLDPEPRTASLPRSLAIAEHYLDEHLGGPVSMLELARAAGVSEGHLRSLFRDHRDCSPIRWHRRRRIELAQRLLSNPRLSIADVAKACGWEDANLFGRVFRAECGQSPGRWRHR